MSEVSLRSVLTDPEGRTVVGRLDVPGGSIYMIYDEPGGRVVSSSYVPGAKADTERAAFLEAKVKLLEAEVDAAWKWRASLCDRDWHIWVMRHEDVVKFLKNTQETCGG